MSLLKSAMETKDTKDPKSQAHKPVGSQQSLASKCVGCPQAANRATKLHTDSVFWSNKKQSTNAFWKRTEFLPQASKVFEPHFSMQEEPYSKAFHCKI